MKYLNKALIIVCVTAIVGCAEQNKKEGNTSKNIEITHELGTISVKKNPERVIVFDIGTMDTFDKLGIKFIGAPVQNIPPYLSKYKSDNSIIDVGSVKEANFEKINELKPDLIIISGRLQNSYDELSQIAPTLYMGVDFKNYMPSFEKNTKLIGQIFNKEEEVNQSLISLKNKIEKNAERISSLSGKGLIILYNNGRFSSYGKNSRFGFVHDVMGVKTAIDDIEVATHGQVISSEFIEKTNPDYLFIVDRGAIVKGKSSGRDEVENELIKQTNASKNDKIIYLNPEIWYLSGGGLISVEKMIDEVSDAVK